MVYFSLDFENGDNKLRYYIRGKLLKFENTSEKLRSGSKVSSL